MEAKLCSCSHQRKINCSHQTTTVGGRYARLCVELPLEFPVQPFIYIGRHKQYIHYEGENFLCKNCGRLGHTLGQCTYVQKENKEKSSPNKDQSTAIIEDTEGEWKTVSFNKGKKQSPKNNSTIQEASTI